MPYTPYYNAYQQPFYQSPMQDQLSQLKQVQYQPPQQQPSPIIWVQGEAAARAYMVAAGNSVLLMDSDASVFYLKSTDSSGMPQPMRIFDYQERNAGKNVRVHKDTDEFVTRKEFDDFVEKVNGMVKGFGEEVKDGQSVI